jgi:hypothetical protein
MPPLRRPQILSRSANFSGEILRICAKSPEPFLICPHPILHVCTAVYENSYGIRKDAVRRPASSSGLPSYQRRVTTL